MDENTGSFVLVSERYPKRCSTLKMSSQRSDWRERLHANPSRMEQELAIKLQDNRIMYLNRTIVWRLFLCLVPSGRESRGPLSKLGLGNTGRGPCRVRAQLLWKR